MYPSLLISNLLYISCICLELDDEVDDDDDVDGDDDGDGDDDENNQLLMLLISIISQLYIYIYLINDLLRPCKQYNQFLYTIVQTVRFVIELPTALFYAAGHHYKATNSWWIVYIYIYIFTNSLT